jgi:hypothetical protein
LVGFAHVVLQLSLCNPMVNLPPSTTIDVKLRMVDETGRRDIKQDLSFQRGSGLQHNIEFDAPRGTFKVGLVAPKTGCGFVDFLSFISEAPRTIHEDLLTSPPPEKGVILFDGLASESFLAANPQFVLFPKDMQCAAPISDPPPPPDVRLENDGTSFYVWMNLNQALSGLLALQVSTPTGEYHYIRLRPKLTPWDGWPRTVQFNVTQDLLDSLSDVPTDQLYCPKNLVWSSVSG